MGRAIYDNLMRYIRFQMGVLFGFIATFLGASIFNIASGIPFLPLQTLWVNFTVDVFQAIGLGYGKPREGLMKAEPRPKDAVILPRRLMTWLVIVGLIMAAGTLAIISWGTGAYGDAVARTMGVTAFSLFNLFFSLETADEERSLFSGDILQNPTLLKTTALSVVAIILTTELGFLQRLLGTVSLNADQWIICTVVALSIVVVAEVKKAMHIRTTEAPVEVAAVAGASGASIASA